MTIETAGPVIDAYVSVIPDIDGLWVVDHADGSRRGRCIEAARLSVAVLRRAGLECKAMACDVMAMSWMTAAAVQDGRTPRTQAIMVSCDKDLPGFATCEHDRCERDAESFSGHLVVVGPDWFLDLSAPQFHRPNIGVFIPGPIMGPGGWEGPGVMGLSDQGTQVHYRWRPEVARWRRTPAWRQDVPRGMVEAFLQRMAVPVTHP